MYFIRRAGCVWKGHGWVLTPVDVVALDNGYEDVRVIRVCDRCGKMVFPES